MTNLSPAAIAVLEAVHLAMAHQQVSLSGVPDYRQVAAALRAAADQVVPGDGSRRANEIRSEFLAIAAELEGME